MTDHSALLLSIDTSAGTSVAVVREGSGILSQADGLDTMKHAEVIGRLIEQALSEAGVRVDELTGVVAGMGPGPFTGLRVGIAAARVFALGAGVPLLPVVSHDAIALAETSGAAAGELLVTTDARRREVYWSLYASDGRDGVPVRLDGPGLAKPDDLPHPHARRSDGALVSGGQLGLVALAALRSGAALASDQALYLRSPDVTVSMGAKRVTQ